MSRTLSIYEVSSRVSWPLWFWDGNEYIENFPYVVIEATDISTDRGCSRALDPDMGLGRSPDSDITMAPDGKQPTLLKWLLTVFTSSELSLSM
ncbi:hypothetical protein STEG23_020654 [Scotinomys teguina]